MDKSLAALAKKTGIPADQWTCFHGFEAADGTEYRWRAPIGVNKSALTIEKGNGEVSIEWPSEAEIPEPGDPHGCIADVYRRSFGADCWGAQLPGGDPTESIDADKEPRICSEDSSIEEVLVEDYFYDTNTSRNYHVRVYPDGSFAQLSE